MLLSLFFDVTNMPRKRDIHGDLPYDRKDVDSILRYAARLTGRTLNEILDVESGKIGDTHTKGYFGQSIESEYFLIDNNSDPVPDFEEVGMELKVTPMKEVRGGLVSKERLVLGIIDYNEVPSKGFRIFLDKNSHILIVFYLWKEGQDIYDYRVLKVVDWTPLPEELRIIKEDWDVIEGYVLRGEAHLLSERHTRFLAACTKGVGHGGDMRTQPNSSELAKQRALSFKASFMTSLYHSHPDVNECLIDVTDDEESVFHERWEDDLTFNEYVLGHLDRFRGRTCQEIEDALGIHLSERSKQYYYTLTLAMLGVHHRKHVKEFEQAGISIKTVRILQNGTPKESMSFPAFRYEDVVEQTWETSDFFEQIDHEFFIPVFQFNTKYPKEEPRKSLTFRGSFFWSVPDDDIEIIRGVWEDTRSKVIEERFDDFIASSDRRISHVRPHGRDSRDTYPYKGKEYVKKGFWLNKQYMKEVIRRELKGRSSLEGLR